MSRNIHFGTAELVKDMKNNTLITSIEQVIQAYQTRGFRIKAILADGQFVLPMPKMTWWMPYTD